ncbi:HSF-type DNA-binding protein [Nitzschia inconspicua]|uniref:HSF-type DNA-binding protein n=1 Tax=Nitzschia inconspicua TaxID=303405 RepID=A0A9K3LCA0_9STRA|nr:HSF-type DNA-binding protein [Nitzschia inconspicua]
MILTHSQMIEANNHAAATVSKNFPNSRPDSDSSSTASSTASPSASLFPKKLHAMLEDASQKGFDDVVCWMPGGSSFKVLDPARFTDEVMPKYFNQRKYKSFLRQLNLYDFSRIHHGPLKGGYAHKFFLQGMPGLCEKINKATTMSRDQMIKTHRRVVSSEHLSHIFFGEDAMDSPRSDMSISTQHNPTSFNHYSPVDAGVNGNAVSDLNDSQSSRSSRYYDMDMSLSALTPLPMEAPVNTAVTREAIQHILPETTQFVQSTPANEIFHEEPISFHNMDTQVEKALLSTFVADDRLMEKDIGIAPIGMDKTLADDLLAIINDEPSTPHTMGPPADLLMPKTGPTFTLTSEVSPLATGAFSEFNFPRKVYRMLDDAEINPNYKAIVSWVEEGMAFKVHNKKLFVEKILPIYFDMTQYASFRRQLNMYSFERKHTSTYLNPFFVRGCPDLLEKIIRKSGSSKSKKSDKK